MLPSFPSSAPWLRRLLAVAGCAVLLAIAGQAPAATPARLPTDPALRIGRLPNGLTYYIRRNPQPAGRLELRLALKAGSLLEDDDQRGLAHLVEHMAFRGSAHFEPMELVSFMASIGVRFGADMNAETGFDRTVYQLSLPTAQRAHVEQAFTVLEDWARGLRLDDDAILRELPVLEEELNLRLGADERIERQLLAGTLKGTRHAQRPPMGEAALLRAASPAAARRYYRDWYRPALMAVVVVGDIDPADAERRLRAHFGDWNVPGPARPRTEALRPVAPGGGVLVATDPELGGASVAFRYPAWPAANRDRVADVRVRLHERLVLSILGQRLDQQAQQADAPFRRASASIESMPGRLRAFNMGAALNGHAPEQALAALAREAARVRAGGFGDAEVARARSELQIRYEAADYTRDDVASDNYADEYVRNFVDGEALPSRADESRLGLALLRATTRADLEACARRLLPAGVERLVVYRGNAAFGQPAPERLRAALDASPPARALRDAGVQAAAAAAASRPAPAGSLLERLLPAAPRPGRVLERRQDPALGLTYLTLANGVRVILKPNDGEHGFVLLGGVREGGLARFNAAELADARYADRIATEMGAGPLSPLALRQRLTGISASLATSTTLFNDVVDGSAGADLRSIEGMLRFLWFRFVQVRSDPALYRRFIQAASQNAAEALAAPANQARRALLELLYRGQPYAQQQETPADIAAIDAERSLALYRRQYASAAGFTFVLVGDFQVDQLIPLLETWLGGLPAAPRAAPPHDVSVHAARGILRRDVASAGQGELRLVFSGPAAEFSPIEQLRLDAVAEIMSLRIGEVLRTRLGLVYASSVSGSLERSPSPSYTLDLVLPASPARLEAVREAAFSEIARLRRDGPTQAELDKFRVGTRESQRLGLRGSRYWLNQLKQSLADGVEPAALLRQAPLLDSLDTEQVRAAAARYFDLANYALLVQAPAVLAAGVRTGDEPAGAP